MLRRRPAPVVSRIGAALFGALIALAAASLAVPILPVDDDLAVGDRAPTTFLAAEDAQYESEVLTQAARDAAASAVEPVTLAPDPNIVQQQRAALEDLFGQVGGIRELDDVSPEDQLILASELDGADQIGATTLTTLLVADTTGFGTIRTATLAGLNDILAGAVLSTDIAARVDAFLLTDQAPETSEARESVRQILLAFVLPNVEIDEAGHRGTPPAGSRQRDPRDSDNRRRPADRCRGRGPDGFGHRGRFARPVVIDDSFDYADLAAGLLFATGLGAVLGIYVHQLQPFPQPARGRMVLTGITIVATIAAARFAIPALIPDDDRQFFAAALPHRRRRNGHCVVLRTPLRRGRGGWRRCLFGLRRRHHSRRCGRRVHERP